MAVFTYHVITQDQAKSAKQNLKIILGGRQNLTHFRQLKPELQGRPYKFRCSLDTAQFCAKEIHICAKEIRICHQGNLVQPQANSVLAQTKSSQFWSITINYK